jgi:putative transposase
VSLLLIRPESDRRKQAPVPWPDGPHPPGAGSNGVLLPHRFLIHDQAPFLTDRFAYLLRSAGIELAKLPPRSSNLNAYAERFVQSVKEECVSRIIPIGERHLRHAIKQCAEHYHLERNHQGLGNRLIDGEPEADPVHDVECNERLGGRLRSYRRAA